jgi:hypothetical protein
MPQVPDADSSVRVPRYWLYWGSTILVLLFIGIWWGGALAGKTDAERRYASQLANEESASPPQSNNATQSDTVRPDQSQVAPVPDPGPTPPKPVPTSGGIYHAGQWVSDDPRIKGMNYLHLATLPKAEAARAVDFLRSRGRQAAAVPSKVVDRSPDGGKNPSLFVYLLNPLTRDQYRDAPTRTRIENDAKALGKEWAKKERGKSDFSQPGWVKFE